MAPEPALHRATAVSRRALLAGATMGVAALAVPLATAERAAALVRTPGLRRSRFTPLLHAPFQMLDSAGRSVNVVLSEINDLKPTVAAASETRFSLLFEGPVVPAHPQATYRFSHPRLGEVTLFVVPIGRAVRAQRYEAIIYQK